MIYLITGVPGSGKTLYAISTLVKKLMSERPKGRDGKEIDRRLLIDGVPDLLIPHEVLPPLIEDDKGQMTCEGDGILTWPKWCMPGDLIVVDEVQRYWRPRGMGTKPPEMIKALETHRHLGVDFIIITQNPMLIDQNVRRLIGRHQHVRRLFGMARAIIYDWDSCSMDVNRTRTATTTTWAYPKAAYKLYKSSALHLKQRQKIPLWVVVPILAIVGMVAVAPTAFGTMRGAMSGKGIGSTAAAAPAASAPQSVASSAVAVSTIAAASSPIAASSGPAPVASAPSAVASEVAPVLAGCIKGPKKCGCFDTQGRVFKMDADACLDNVPQHRDTGVTSDIALLRSEPDRRYEAMDADVLGFMAKHPVSLPQ